jgi:hypothetical protein
MTRSHAIAAAAIIFASIATCGAALAQTPAPSEPSTVAQVETWTLQQWETAKAAWAQNTTKWADCQKQSSHRKQGRDSWSFLYTCMKG